MFLLHRQQCQEYLPTLLTKETVEVIDVLNLATRSLEVVGQYFLRGPNDETRERSSDDVPSQSGK